MTTNDAPLVVYAQLATLVWIAVMLTTLVIAVIRNR